jgi:hypothetical protein
MSRNSDGLGQCRRQKRSRGIELEPGKCGSGLGRYLLRKNFHSMAVRMANISDTLPSVVDGLPKMYRWGLAWFGGGDPPEIITLL